MLNQDKIKEEVTDKVFQSVMEDIGKHYKVSDSLSDVLIDSFSLHLPSAISHLSAQYEKLIGEVLPEEKNQPEYGLDNYEHPEADQAFGYNACLNTIRTSLQERGIIIK